MLTYQELKKKHAEEINAFPFGWAFSKQQFEVMLDEHNWRDPTRPSGIKPLVSIGAGGYLLKEDVPKMEEMFKRHKREIKAFKKQENEFIKGLVYEMSNHEFVYCEDTETVLNIFGYTEDDLLKNDYLKKCYKKALKKYYNSIKENKK